MKTLELTDIVKKAIEEYQCPGCVAGSDIECGKFAQDLEENLSCIEHTHGTMIGAPGLGIIEFFLGLPNGFNRVGPNKGMRPLIYNKFEDCDWNLDDKWNVPVWSHVNSDNHTLVRVFCPRNNTGFIHIYLENCLDKLKCIEITAEDIKEMD